MLLFVAGFTLRASSALSDSGLNAYAQWSNILALPLTALGTAQVLLERAVRRGDTSEATLRNEESRLAREILTLEREELARLLGVDEPETRGINLGFRRDELRYRDAGGENAGTLETVWNYYRGIGTGRLTIIGAPGSGKTVLALHLLIQLLEHRADPAADGPRPPVPVRFSLAAFDVDRPLADWLAQQLTDRFRTHPAVARALVGGRRILPVLDGLDEMDPGEGPAERATETMRWLNRYLAGTDPAPAVLTCRRDRYEQLPAIAREATDIYIQPLDAEQISSYLLNQFQGVGEELSWQPILGPLQEGGPVAQAIAAVLCTPWRLTQALAFARGGGDPAELLPAVGPDGVPDTEMERISRLLLGRFIPAVTRLHPRRVGRGYSPDRDAKQVETWLRVIADHLAQRERAGGNGTDIVLHQWWPIAGARVRYWHAALASLAVLLSWFVIALIRLGSPDQWAELLCCTATREVPRGVARTGTFLIIYVVLAIAVAIASFRPWPQPRQLDLRLVRTSKALRGVALGVLLGAVFGVLLDVALHIEVTLLGCLTFGIAGGIAGTLLVGIEPGLAGALKPHDPIRKDVGFYLASSLVVGAALGMGNGVMGHFDVAGGLVGGFVGGLAVGLGAAAIRYGLTVTLMAVPGRLPWRLGAFLDWAYRAGLLRISGIAYQFRHRELQLWLTAGRPMAANADADPAV
jgi:hypothetical protein